MKILHFKAENRTFQSDLKQHHQDLNTPGPADVRRHEIRGARTFVMAEKQKLDRALAEVEKSYESAHEAWFGAKPEAGPPRPSTESGLTARAGQLFLLLVEALLAAMLAVRIFNFQAFIAATIGVLITIALYYMLRSVLTVLVVGRDIKPQETLKRLDLPIRFLAIIWLATVLALITLARLVSVGFPFLEILLGGLLSVLTIASPALAACLGVAYNIRFWGNQAAASWASLQTKLHRLDRLSAHADAVERTLPDTIERPRFGLTA